MIQDGNTALLVSSSSRNIDITALLLKHGADVHIPYKVRKTFFVLYCNRNNIVLNTAAYVIVK